MTRVRLTNDRQMIESLRDSDFDCYSAYGEVVDNAIQAGATFCRIRVKIKNVEQKQLILKRELNNKIAAVKREQQKIKRLYLQGVISKSVYNSETSSLEKRKFEIRNRFKSK